MGAWKARFSMSPIRQSDLSGSDFADWDADTQWMKVSKAAEDWARENAKDIEEKRAEYWPDWQAKELKEREEQTLRPEDGR